MSGVLISASGEDSGCCSHATSAALTINMTESDMTSSKEQSERQQHDGHCGRLW